ncbi:MAG: hypothetical protein MUE82_01695 [Chloroflexi bacterium]|nr:hypothetical protein [Chloroflexota bacterium]
MSILNLALWGLGILLVVIGYTRAAPAWRRYRALTEQDANVRRYEQWRGGPRLDDRTGASVAMEVLRRRARIWGLVALGGVVLVFLGFFLR